MAPIDGAIGMKININHPQTTDVNISKAQPSKASGLGGVCGLDYFMTDFIALEGRPGSYHDHCIGGVP